MNEHCYDTRAKVMTPIDKAIIDVDERIEHVLSRLATLETRLSPVLYYGQNAVDEPKEEDPQFESDAPLVCTINRFSGKLEVVDEVISRITDALAL